MEFIPPFENFCMIEKPNISEEKIKIALNANYSIRANRIKFLPIGNDSSAFAYSVETKNGISYFLKLKHNLSNLAGLFVPRFLKDNRVEQVVAPLLTKTQKLWVQVDKFAFILYPFVIGNEAMEAGMTDAQWTEFCSVLKRV